MSSEIYELMKRPDEQYVVDRAHRRPRFVEDSVREMIRGVAGALPRPARRRLRPRPPGQLRDHPHPRRRGRALRHGRRDPARAGRAREHGAPTDAARVARRRVPRTERVPRSVNEVAVTAVGADRPGIVAALTGALLEHRRQPGGDARRAPARVVRDGARRGRPRRRRAGRGRGRAARRSPRSSASGSGSGPRAPRPRRPPLPRCVVSVYGADHPGIVHGFARPWPTAARTSSTCRRAWSATRRSTSSGSRSSCRRALDAEALRRRAGAGRRRSTGSR